MIDESNLFGVPLKESPKKKIGLLLSCILELNIIVRMQVAPRSRSIVRRIVNSSERQLHRTPSIEVKCGF